MFDLGDVVFLADPSTSEWEELDIPGLGANGYYHHNKAHGKGIRVHHTSSPACWDMLCEKISNE